MVTKCLATEWSDRAEDRDGPGRGGECSIAGDAARIRESCAAPDPIPLSHPRIATVFPAPTSPVITPIACWSTHQDTRATASACPGWRCSIPRCQVPHEWHPCKTVMCLQPFDTHADFSCGSLCLISALSQDECSTCRALQPPKRQTVEKLLRAQADPEPHAHPRFDGAGPPTHRRSVGIAPR